MNAGAVNRLGAAGVSVPGFGIGRSSPAHVASPSPPPPRPAAGGAGNSNGNGNGNGGGYGAQVNELQNRFSKLGTSSPASASSPAPPPPPSQGTTWAQKQAALKTASSFHKDPSSVSFSDAKAAASTANNFRQRHGDQVAAGVRSANSLNQKYGLADKAGALAGRGQVPAQASPGEANASNANADAVASALAGKKKPPPPPPKKKPGLSSAAPVNDDAPPPIPMSTRPTF